MAGIGFKLRKLSQQDNLLGISQGFLHSMLATSGPWLLTVIALGGMAALGGFQADNHALWEFRLIVIYNFAFSLVFTGPFMVLATRCLSDMIHDQRVNQAPSMLLGAIASALAVQLPLVIGFYWFYADLPFLVALLATMNYLLVASLWLVSVFLSALKDYTSVTWAFVAGTVISLSLIYLVPTDGSSNFLISFNFGLTLTFFALFAKVISEYPYSFSTPFVFLKKMRPYWQLVLGGLVYNVSIWIDKWVMWFAPERVLFDNNMFSYPQYDSAMFMAYLTSIPALTLFFIFVETNLFEKYLRYYRDIQNHADYATIKSNHNGLISALKEGGRDILVIQLSIAIFVILISSQLFAWFNLDYMQLSIFRFGVLGGAFHIFSLLLIVILTYFEFRAQALAAQLFFLISNGLFTWIFMNLGFEYYGFGYFLAALSTFALTAWLLYSHIRNLPFWTFVGTNPSIQNQ